MSNIHRRSQPQRRPLPPPGAYYPLRERKAPPHERNLPDRASDLSSLPSKPNPVCLQHRSQTETSASSETASTLGETLSLSSSSHTLLTPNSISSGTNGSNSTSTATTTATPSAYWSARSDIEEEKDVPTLDVFHTGPVDVDEVKPIVDLVDPDGPFDVDSFVGDWDDYYSNSSIGEDFILDEPDDLFRELAGYEVGFEPEVITEVISPAVAARRKFSKEMIPSVIKEDSFETSVTTGASASQNQMGSKSGHSYDRHMRLTQTTLKAKNQKPKFNARTYSI